MIHSTPEAGLSDLPIHVDKAIRDLQPHVDEFDSIAVEGLSGILVAVPVALALGKPLVVVRKDSEYSSPTCWHISPVENAGNAGNRVLFFDDHIDYGRTLTHVRIQIRRYTPFGVVGKTYQWETGRYAAVDEVELLYD